MTIFRGPATIVAALAAIACCCGADTAAIARRVAPASDAGQWWQVGGDGRLSGRSLLKGNIIKPAVVWKHRVAARETLLAATLNSGHADAPLPTSDLSLPGGGISRERLLADRGAASPWYDLDGNGKPVFESLISYNTKVGKVLPDVAGFQLITCEALNYPDRQPYLGTVRLKVRDNGAWRTKWEMTTDTLIWVAEPMFGDFDYDGRKEIALLPWYKLNILDAETGKVKEQAAFKLDDEAPELGGRAYGWFGAANLDGAGPDEFVIVDDFVHHMAVVGWRDGKLQRLWNWIIHQPGQHMPEATDTVAVIINPRPVQNVDGDANLELLVSIFNHRRDARWHVVAIDGMTGKVKHDLDGWFLSGTGDLDGDGFAELLCTKTGNGLRRPDPASLAVFSLKGGEPRAMWELPDSSFESWDIPDFPEKVNSGASTPRRTVLCEPLVIGGKPVFFTRRQIDAATNELTTWQADDTGKILQIARASGPQLRALAIRTATSGSTATDGPVLLRTSTADDRPVTVSCDGISAQPLHSQFVSPPTSPPVIGRMKPGDLPTVIVQGADESIEAIRPQAGGTVRQLWRVPGRAMTCNNYFEGALLANLAGESSLHAVIGTRGPGDCARLTVIDADGKEFWHRDFDEFPGTPPPWNVPGLMYWQGAYLRDPGQMDLLVQLRRIGGETWMLDGRTGEQKWFRSHSTDKREFGRTWFTLYDHDGDGLEDVLTNYPDVYCVADGKSGDLRIKKQVKELVPGDGYYGSSVAYDFLGDGTTQLLYCNVNAIALLRRDGTAVWKTPFDVKDPRHPNYGSDVRPAPGDADGDGRLEIFVPGIKVAGNRELQCLDAATGAMKWRLPLPTDRSMEPAVADIDGDGRDECILAIGSNVHAIGCTPDGKDGVIKWTLPLPNYLSNVAIADVLGDGKPQIVVSCSDGFVYGIGASRQ